MGKAIDSNADVVSKAMQKVAKQMPFATSKALNKVAYDMREYMIARMPAEMDRPTPFTMKGVQYKKSTKHNLVASVFIEAKRATYLKFQIEGGMRTPRGTAIPVPTSASKLNVYGNMSRGYLKRLRGQRIHIPTQGGFGRVSRKRGRKSFGNYRKFFSGIPKGGGRPAGLWERHTGNKRLRPIVLWEPNATYKAKRFDFYGIGQRFSSRNFKRELSNALREALKQKKA